jgi:hypothetical protein
VSDHELASRLSYFIWSSMPDDELLDLADRGKLSARGASAVPVHFRGAFIHQKTEDHQRFNLSKAFDGDLATAVEGPVNEGLWIGRDFHQPRPVRKVRFAPKQNEPKPMVGGRFQGSNKPDFSDGVVDLLTVSDEPKPGWNEREVSNHTPVRYVRYLPPKDSWGKVAEIEFHVGMDGTVLEQQVRRMLADPKAKALTDRFAAQWFGLRHLEMARPSTEFFPTFNAELRRRCTTRRRRSSSTSVPRTAR